MDALAVRPLEREQQRLPPAKGLDRARGRPRVATSKGTPLLGLAESQLIRARRAGPYRGHSDFVAPATKRSNLGLAPCAAEHAVKQRCRGIREPPQRHRDGHRPRDQGSQGESLPRPAGAREEQGRDRAHTTERQHAAQLTGGPLGGDGA